MIARNPALIRAFAKAENEFGVAEWTNGHNPRIIEYHSATDYGSKDQNESWCASFCCWCLKQSNVLTTRSPRARSFLAWGREVDEPQVGDLIVLSRGSNPYNGHVGFYYPTTPVLWQQGKVLILGGNQSNQVCIKPYDRDRILSMRTYHYEDSVLDDLTANEHALVASEEVIQQAEVSWEEVHRG